MTKQEIFKTAHKLAKSFVGHYAARFALALKSVYQSLKAKIMVEVKFSMTKAFGGKKGVTMRLEGYGHGFGAIDPESLGFDKLDSNTWTKTCYTAEEIDAARNPLKAFVTSRRSGNAVILEA